MCTRIVFTIVCLLLALMPGLALASDITDATHVSDIVVVNGAPSTQGNAAVVVDIPGQELEDGLYVQSDWTDSALRTSAGVDMPYMPPTDGELAAMWVPTIGPNATQSYRLYTGGGTDMASKIRYFPGTAGMTVADAASLEPGNWFSLATSGYVNTGASMIGQNIVNKPNAVRTYVSAAGTVTTNVYPSFNYSCTGEATWIPLYSGSTTRVGERFTTFPASTITSAVFKLRKTLNPTGNATVNVRTTDDTILGTLGTIDTATLTESFTDYTFSGTVANTIAQDLRICIEYAGGNGTNCVLARYSNANLYANGVFATYNGSWTDDAASDSYFLVGYSTLASVSGAVSTGEHEIETSYQPNYIVNSSFEIGDPPTGWTAENSVLSRESTIIKLGTSALKTTASATVYGNAFQEVVSYASLLGKQVTFGTWLRAPSTNTATQCRIAIKSKSDNSDLSWGAEIPKDNEWHWVTVSLTVSATADMLRTLIFANTSTSSSDVVYSDGAILSPGTTLPNNYYNFNMFVDDVAVGYSAIDSNIMSVVDNANNWEFFTGGVMPYVEYAEITVGGVQKGYWSWENNSTTFSDQSGNGNTATPTFLATGTNPNLAADWRNFRAIATATMTATAGVSDPNFIGDPPDEPSEMYTDNDYSKLPGADLINTVLDAGDIPREIFWFPAFFGSVIGVIFLVYWLSKSMVAAVVAGGVVLAFIGILGPIPLWIVIPYAVACAAIVVKRESASLS